MSLIDEIRNEAADFLDDFGEDAVYTSNRDGTKIIIVIFEKEKVLTDPYTGTVNNIPATILAYTKDVKNARHKDKIEIQDTIYEIEQPPDNDDAGLSTITLTKILD